MVAALALLAFVGCFEQESSVIKTSDRRSKVSTPPVPLEVSIVVEKSGDLELCIDGASTPVNAEDVQHARTLLGERLTQIAGSGEVMDTSCIERFRLRPDLATCTTSETLEVDGGKLGLEVVRRHYLVGACERRSNAERECTKALGTWKVADPKEPGVATERFRQKATRVLGEVNQKLRKAANQVSRPPETRGDASSARD